MLPWSGDGVRDDPLMHHMDKRLNLMSYSLPITLTLIQMKWEKMVSFIPWRACGKSRKNRQLEWDEACVWHA